MFRPKKNEYFVKLAEDGYLPASYAEIEQAIAEKGCWEAAEEWRVGVWTDFRITKFEKDGNYRYRVEVRCDHEFCCYCLTLSRAIQMAGLYHNTIMELFQQLDRMSWVSSDEMAVGGMRLVQKAG